MEFPNLGKHCDLKNCRQLDFLPFYCRDCKKYYCKDHSYKKDHKCEKKVIRKENKEFFKSKNIKLYRCYVRGCKQQTYFEYKCTECGQQTCTAHMHHFIHDKLQKKKRKYKSNVTTMGDQMKDIEVY
jgi:predicted nucleic acid binding AN1-type Zn finger protein